MARKLYRIAQFVSFLKLTDDVGELLELLSQAESLNVQAENELKLRRNEIDLIKAKLKKVRNDQRETQISDHAIVRYLDRVVGIDIEACKKEMLAKLPQGFNPHEEIEFVRISVDGLQYVMRDNLVVSVTPTEATDSLDSGEGRANTELSSELAPVAPSKKGSKENEQTIISTSI